MKQSLRKNHYILGHEAFRLMCESDPLRFFELMASSDKSEFIKALVTQVEKSCSQADTPILVNDITVKIASIHEKPLVLIKMPKPQAYVECFYVAIVGLFDMAQPQNNETVMIRYFTLELGEGEQGDCCSFCEWQGDSHINLAELALGCELETFQLLIEQRITAQ